MSDNISIIIEMPERGAPEKGKLTLCNNVIVMGRIFNGNGGSKLAGITFSGCRFEVKEGYVFENCKFFNCTIKNSTFTDCEITNSKIYGSKIYDSKITQSEVTESTIIGSEADACKIINCEICGGDFNNSNITLGFVRETKLTRCKCMVVNVEAIRQCDDACEFIVCALPKDHRRTPPMNTVKCSWLIGEEDHREWFPGFAAIIIGVAKFNDEYTDASISLAMCCAVTIFHIDYNIPEIELKDKFISNAFQIEYDQSEMDMIRDAVSKFALCFINSRSFIREYFPTLNKSIVEYLMTIGMYHRGVNLLKEKKFDDFQNLLKEDREKIAKMNLSLE